jgi:hypothetical protein
VPRAYQGLQGAMSSTMFMLGLVATDIAMLVIAPCSPW